jgi:hypothetical protein
MGNMFSDAFGFLGDAANAVGNQASRFGHQVGYLWNNNTTVHTPWGSKAPGSATGPGEVDPTIGTDWQGNPVPGYFADNAPKKGGTAEQMAWDAHASDRVIDPRVAAINAAGVGPGSAGYKPGMVSSADPARFAGGVAPGATQVGVDTPAPAHAPLVFALGMSPPDVGTTTSSTAVAAANPITSAAAVDSYGQSQLALEKQLADQNNALRGNINDLQNPYDPNGQIFKSNLGRAQDDVNRNYAGADQRVMTDLGSRGQAGGVGAGVAEVNMERAHQQALSDASSGLYKDALQGNSDFQFKKINALDNLNHGNFADAMAGYNSLTGANATNRAQTFTEKQGTAATDLADKEFLHTVTNDAAHNALATRALDIAQQNRLDDKETSMWGNLIKGAGIFGEPLLKGIESGKIDIKKMLKDWQGGGDAAVKADMDQTTGAQGPITMAPLPITTMPISYPGAGPGIPIDQGYGVDRNFGNLG